MTTRILLIERGAGDYRRLRSELERLGNLLGLERAATTREGLDRLGRARFDVLLLDFPPRTRLSSPCRMVRRGTDG